MATILELVAKGDLEKIDPDLDPDELEERQIYMLGSLVGRVEKTLASIESRWETELNPSEQLDELVYNFVSGEPLNYPRGFHDIDHKRDGVWMLKAPNLRLFGFFPTKDIFVCTDLVEAGVVKHQVTYAGMAEQSWFKRESLDLTPPKFIEGSDPSDVVSNCYS